MRIYLNVPYEQKDLAKRRGCRWDGIRKQWFIDDPLHMELFVQWVPDILKRLTKLINKASTALNVSKSRRKYGKV